MSSAPHCQCPRPVKFSVISSNRFNVHPNLPTEMFNMIIFFYLTKYWNLHSLAISILKNWLALTIKHTYIFESKNFCECFSCKKMCLKDAKKSVFLQKHCFISKYADSLAGYVILCVMLDTFSNLLWFEATWLIDRDIYFWLHNSSPQPGEILINSQNFRYTVAGALLNKSQLYREKRITFPYT